MATKPAVPIVKKPTPPSLKKPVVPVKKPAPISVPPRPGSTPPKITKPPAQLPFIGPGKPPLPNHPTVPPGTKPPSQPNLPGTPPKKPGPPSIDDYLGGDAAYQMALSGGKRSLKDYLSELGRRRGEAGTQFGQTKGSMERDRRRALDDIREEFASRGLIHSGLYGKEQGNFQEKFSEQLNSLEQQQTGLVGDLLAQETNYRRENDLATQQAKQEALLRRAQKYNIGA